MPESELPAVLDRVKRETALILGSYSTMLRNEIFDFAQIGAFVERADSTARIIDVKYHLLLPSVSHVGTILDNYQWGDDPALRRRAPFVPLGVRRATSR